MGKKKNDDYSEVSKGLAALGVPEHIIAYVIEQRPIKSIYTVLSVLLILVLIFGFLLGVFLFIKLESQAINTIKSFAPSIDGLLYHTNFGLAGLIAVFAWIFTAGVLIYTISKMHHRTKISVFVYSLLDPGNEQYNWIFKIPNIDTLHPVQFIDTVLDRAKNIFLVPTLILIALTLSIINFEYDAYKIYTKDSLIDKPFFPWKSDRIIKWDNVESVALGCNHVTGKHASDDIIYEVKLPNKKFYRISNSTPITGDLLSQLEIIDANITKLNPEYTRWKWSKRNPIHPDCLEAQKLKYGEENYHRVEALLRVNEF